MAADDGLGPYDAKNLVDGFRWGMPRLTDAAPGVLEPAIVAEVVRTAWDRHWDFDARGVAGFGDVEDLGAQANSWSWADAMLYTASFREEFYSLRQGEAYIYARLHFPRLKQRGWDDAVNRAFGRLSRVWLDVEGTSVRLPGWAVRPVMRQYLRWDLLDVASELDAPLIVNGPPTTSIDFLAETGERGLRSIGGYDAAEDGVVIESDHWSRAAVVLSERTGAQVAAARDGAPRQKVDLSHRAATRTLERGAKSAEVRLSYEQDPLLCCYTSLRDVAKDSWARYPKESVPTREVLKRVATETRAEGRPNADWFDAVDARRAELNKRGRLLHDINDLVRGALAMMKVCG